MSLPALNEAGDLPIGVHQCTWQEMEQRFGTGTSQRLICTRRLEHVLNLARRTSRLSRFIVFGSYVTAKPEPNDIDVVLVMDDAFRLEDCPPALSPLFEHALAQARYGASVFWIRPGLLIGEGIEEFIAYWQSKRGGGKRGIVEVML